MKRQALICFLMIMTGFFAQAQKTDSLIKKLDSLKTRGDSASGKKININQTAYNERTKITPRVYFVLLGTDFVQEVTGPFHSSSGTWGKVAGFAVIEGGIFLLDKPVQDYATKLMTRNDKFQGVSHYVTNFGATYEGYTLAALGLYGFVFKNDKIKTTTLLATQSYLVAGAMEGIIKFVTGRQRPNYIADATDPKPRFHGPDFSIKTGSTSFPSGHTTAAFAAATVYAEEYKDRPWVPVLAYSAASLIGLSRITENKHWISDVFAGAALGYVTGLQVVRNYHRYAYLQNHKQKGKVSFNMEYNFGHLEPGFIYTFR
jgi:membrane-associated phospholipid phosphatase